MENGQTVFWQPKGKGTAKKKGKIVKMECEYVRITCDGKFYCVKLDDLKER